MAMIDFNIKGSIFSVPYGGFITPAENDRLTAPELSMAREIIGKLKCEIEHAGPKVAEPANMWNDDLIGVAHHPLMTGDEDALNHLRLYCYNFTGFRLSDFATHEGPESRPDIGPGLSEKLARQASSPDIYVVDHYASFMAVPAECHVTAPNRFGETGWVIDGHISNRDTWATQKRMEALHSAGVIDYLKAAAAGDGVCRVVEIGAGYGALAHALKSVLPHIAYTIVDLAGSLMFSAVYLSILFPDERHQVVTPVKNCPPAANQYIPNQYFDDFVASEKSASLVINTLSLCEMSAEQVTAYGSGISRLIGTGGIFYEQNLNHLAEHTDVAAILAGQFAHRLDLPVSHLFGRARGTPRLWSNAEWSAIQGA